MSKRCFVFIEEEKEIKSISLQLLSEAQRIKSKHPNHIDEVVGIYLTDKETSLDALYKAGANTVIRVKDAAFAQYQTRLYADVIRQIVEEYEPSIFLIGGSHIGRDLAPRVSAKLQTGLTADTTHLDIDEESGLFLMTRPAFGGNLNATIICDEKSPQMATVRDNVFDVEYFDNIVGTCIDFKANISIKSSIELLDTIEKEKPETSITDARIIVSGGRGVSDCFDILKGVAGVLDGEVGASRAVVDQAIASKDIQVGQTGTTVRPVIYIACGISGAIQHTAGMDKSELIIAINTDPNAPIFDIADIGLIADAKKVLPLLQETIEGQS
jgi:electron transfer flavoprotein alpha subunit